MPKSRLRSPMGPRQTTMSSNRQMPPRSLSLSVSVSLSGQTRRAGTDARENAIPCENLRRPCGQERSAQARSICFRSNGTPKHGRSRESSVFLRLCLTLHCTVLSYFQATKRLPRVNATDCMCAASNAKLRGARCLPRTKTCLPTRCMLQACSVRTTHTNTVAQLTTHLATCLGIERWARVMRLQKSTTYRLGSATFDVDGACSRSQTPH